MLSPKTLLTIYYKMLLVLYFKIKYNIIDHKTISQYFKYGNIVINNAIKIKNSNTDNNLK